MTADFPFDDDTDNDGVYNLDSTPVKVSKMTAGNGFGHFIWHSSFQTEIDSEGFYISQGFRFIGQ